MICAIPVNDREQCVVLLDRNSYWIDSVSARSSHQPRRQFLIHLVQLHWFYNDRNILRTVTIEVACEKARIVIRVDDGGVGGGAGGGGRGGGGGGGRGGGRGDGGG